MCLIATFIDGLLNTRESEASCGTGYFGLLPRHGSRDNFTPELPEASLKETKTVIEQDYEKNKQKTMYASWIKLKLSCDEKGIPAPTYKTSQLRCAENTPTVRS